jgi:hypothetical protein
MMQDMNRETKLLVILFSDPNFLAVNILENLLSKNCVVNIVSDDKTGWRERTSHLNSSSRFFLISTDEYKKLANFTYAIFCGGFINKESSTADFKKFISNKNFGNAKALAIFPFEAFSLKTGSRVSISDNAGIIYLGDLMGPRIDLESDLLLPSLINEMVNKRTVTLGVGEIFYPVFIADAAKTIVKWLLSFGPYGKETFLLGRQVSSGDFWKQNLKSFPDLKVLYDTKIETRFVPKGYETIILNSNLNICLNETYRWIIREKLVTGKVKPKIKKETKLKNKKPSRFRFLRPFVLPTFLILFFPLITSIVSSGLLYLSYKQFLLENINSAQTSSLLAKTIFAIGKGESNILGHIPILGRFYKETSYVSLLGETLSDLSVNAIPLAENGRSILGGILGTGIYDVKTPSTEIKTSLDYIYQQISFFQIATQNSAGMGTYSARQILQLVDFDRLKTFSREGGVLATNLPSILGQDINKNYLILFENNMELRPTGGFIGSYGVANFGGGKLNGLNINDIYSADGQLKGHVEPPAPIKDYLNEANWWFRDSNWNPDFPTSAERAEWFLSKEMGQEVDGVVAIDLQPIKDILNYTGPIFLPDYNLTITSDNLYEKTQEEAQANSFPGSRQKASFLTALSRTLIADISKMNPKDRILVLKAFYESLVGRHLQIYLHDASSAEAVDKLGWDGKIQSYSCGEGCYSDFFGEVEANVGVNKSNYFVKRKIDFSIGVDSQKITRNLSIYLENSANPALGASGVYKSYLRVMIPSDSDLISVKSVLGQSETILSPEITREKGRQEVGVLVEVTPGESRVVKFVWQNDMPQDTGINSYGLFVRKQAGVGADALSVKFTGKSGVVSSPMFTLTKGSIYSYNTTLGQDFFTRLSWK